MRKKRNSDEKREVKFRPGYIKNALGSVLVSFGDTKVIVTASAENTKPKWMEKDDPRGWITAEYSLLPASTGTRVARERSKVSGRTQEIQRLIGRSLRACVDLKKMPNLTITIDADVIQADGGTRSASICGGYIALTLAIKALMRDKVIRVNPIKEPIAAISAGVVDDEVLLDLDYEEDSNAQVDANIVLTKSGKIVEFQTTSEGKALEYNEMQRIFKYAKKGIDEIISMY